VKDRQKQRFDDIAAHLDATIPIVASAEQTNSLVANAPEERKLDAFEHGFNTVRDKLAAWISEGFQLYQQTHKDSALVERYLRKYLLRRLGSQLRPDFISESERGVAVWYRPRQPAHKTIVWWIAEAAAGEGEEMLIGDQPLPSEKETDAEMVSRIDRTLAEQWFPPPWLWRIPDFYGRREVVGPKSHTRDTAKTELAYLHWQVWEDIETTIRMAQSRVKVAKAIRPKKPHKQSAQDKYRETYIRRAIREGHSGERFCKYLDQYLVQPLPEWKDWPGSWIAAYRGEHKKKIQDLKSRQAKTAGETKPRRTA
jgi:hypothetical protein